MTDPISTPTYDGTRPVQTVGRRKEAIVRVRLLPGTGQFTLDRSVDGGTLFAWEEDLEFPWWLGGRLGEVLGSVVLKRVWRRNLQRLKSLVEAHRPAGAG